jgi:N-acetylglucosaminyl-diphospho-decaprenol L-rhamnosyltransferase
VTRIKSAISGLLSGVLAALANRGGGSPMTQLLVSGVPPADESPDDPQGTTEGQQESQLPERHTKISAAQPAVRSVSQADVSGTPDVSVSLVNTNSRELLLACLESLQSSGAEVVVLDNASDDGSAAAVRARFPAVRVIEQRHRAGFGANHNTVIRATTGRYVFVLNEDTTSDDWGFERMVAHLDANPRVAALGPRLVYPDGRPQDSAWRFPSPATNALGLIPLARTAVVQSGGSVTRDVDWAMAAAILLRREALDEVGLFDEQFFIYSEETDLALRLRRAGWRTQFFPQVTVVHHESQFSVGIPERRINEMWRGRHRYWRKHHSAAAAEIAALCMGAQYAARALLRARDRDQAGQMRLHARNAIAVRGPGLRELADEWNQQQARTQ